MKFNLILLVLCMAFIVESFGEENPYWDRKVRFCGSILGDELSIICKGIYNEQPSYSSKPKRHVADECCKKPCTRRYLKVNYCGPEPETTTFVTSDTTQQPEGRNWYRKGSRDGIQMQPNIPYGLHCQVQCLCTNEPIRPSNCISA